MLNLIKQSVKKAFYKAGFEIVRDGNTKGVTYSILGLTNLPIKTIIDVGANCGQFAKHISVWFPQARIYSFEPQPGPFKELSAWTQTQKGRVVPFNLALGTEEREIDMVCNVEDNTSSSFLKSTKLLEDWRPQMKKKTVAKTRMTTLDSWAKGPALVFDPDILIKLDTEGYDDRVISGGQELFKKAKACNVEISLDKLFEDQADFRELTNMLYDLGYRYAGNLHQAYAPDGHVMVIDAIFVK